MQSCVCVCAHRYTGWLHSSGIEVESWKQQMRDRHSMVLALPLMGDAVDQYFLAFHGLWLTSERLS